VSGYTGLPNAQPYGATKAGLINFAETLHAECKPKNIDVKVINPGFVKTPMTDQNDFDMPMIISSEDAAQEISEGMQRSAFEIHMPKKFTYIMKLVSSLPYWIKMPLLNKLTRT
jgi:short-subunit dehydrogenase